MLDPLEPPHFGTLLRRLRQEAGLTQAQLAERARLSQRGLQDLERGIHQAPHQGTLDLLAMALGLSGQDGVTFLATAPPCHPWRRSTRR
jgi:transcriptional regulator with XRE-family HTH domain